MMKLRDALLQLFEAEPEWRAFFRSLCEISAFRLRSQTWQFWDELAERGGSKTPRGGRSEGTYPALEDALMGLARELLPETPAAGWDAAWAEGLCKDALTRLGEHHAGLSKADKDALDLSGQDLWDERMVQAGLDNAPGAFRAALRGWERTGLEALENLAKPHITEGVGGETGAT